MAVIYDMESGTIVSENKGVTTIESHNDLSAYGVALQPVQTTTAATRINPCDEYMSILRELLKDL